MFSVSMKEIDGTRGHVDSYPKFADIPKEGERFFYGDLNSPCEVVSVNVIFGNFVRVLFTAVVSDEEQEAIDIQARYEEEVLNV